MNRLGQRCHPLASLACTSATLISGWQTVTALQSKAFDQVDWENVIEEIESMGRSERRELKSRLIALLEYLLKLPYWADERAF